MKGYRFPDDIVKLTDKRKMQFENKIAELEKQKADIDGDIRDMQLAMTVEYHRDAVGMYWDHLSVPERERLGESKDKGYRNPITFKPVANMSFANLPAFQMAMLLVTYSHLTVMEVMEWMDNT
tara:strand:+ start:28131 stop:28499 length:369 start_codon:yes stop_codon:yes gene_type:complete